MTVLEPGRKRRRRIRRRPAAALTWVAGMLWTVALVLAALFALGLIFLR